MEAILAGGKIGLAVLCTLGTLALVPAIGHAGCETSIRVLVAQSRDPIRVQTDGRQRTIRRVGRGVQVDAGPVRARWSSGSIGTARVGGLRVTGSLEAFLDAGVLMLVNEVPLEQYVAGAIGGEMPTDWAGDALRAQAVASRTYVIHQSSTDASRGRGWDVEAGTRSQVYAGLDTDEPARRAVRDTRCEILTRSGQPILAAFHSASGGRTASASEVWGESLSYLVSVDVTDEEDSPDTYWRAGISRSTLGRALKAAGFPIGVISGAVVEDRSESGRVRWIRFRGEQGDVRLSGREIRSALGESTLRSTLFQVQPSSDGFVFVGSGRGHGVGMSQWAARSLADRGATYREILQKFYPGTTLGRWQGSRTVALHDSAAR